jgi:hypothetical protein
MKMVGDAKSQGQNLSSFHRSAGIIFAQVISGKWQAWSRTRMLYLYLNDTRTKLLLSMSEWGILSEHRPKFEASLFKHIILLQLVFLKKTINLNHFVRPSWCWTVRRRQQQHSLLSQASWGRLEMKPKRDEKLRCSASLRGLRPNESLVGFKSIRVTVFFYCWFAKP